MNAGPEERRDEEFVEEEEAEAAREAGALGGNVPPDSDDPARQPLIEGGEGQAEGFELAEEDLENIAAHGDQHRFPDGLSRPEEPQDPDEYGEPDEPIPADENE
ncbi:MAG TPA: hypothetical protein VMF55_06510 [Solirubrobacterales bacterium]|nr:hypothetical protein [Solirubrobacterales bacterium]